MVNGKITAITDRLKKTFLNFTVTAETLVICEYLREERRVCKGSRWNRLFHLVRDRDLYSFYIYTLRPLRKMKLSLLRKKYARNMKMFLSFF